MYFTACKPVDRNTECDALCGNREEKGGREEEKERERGGRETIGASAETNERRNASGRSQVYICVRARTRASVSETRKTQRDVALVCLMHSGCNESIDKSSMC